jgi:VPDSG-CTERM motif
MRTSPFLSIALILAGQAYANMIPLSGVRSDDLPVPHFDFLFTSTNHGNILGATNFFGANHLSGILLPDVYTLRFNADISTVPDPLGDFKQADYSLNFRVAPVPDAGSTLTLLGLALCVIGGISRKLNLA